MDWAEKNPPTLEQWAEEHQPPLDQQAFSLTSSMGGGSCFAPETMFMKHAGLSNLVHECVPAMSVAVGEQTRTSRRASSGLHCAHVFCAAPITRVSSNPICRKLMASVRWRRSLPKRSGGKATSQHWIHLHPPPSDRTSP